VKYAAYWIQIHKELLKKYEECKKHLLITYKKDTIYVYKQRGSEAFWKSNMW
jgi:hypothetical protein